MDETREINQPKIVKIIHKYSLAMFIAVSILIAMAIVTISMYLYNTSGAAQLDLSRPGYVSVRAMSTDGDDTLNPYSANGKISLKILNDFEKSFNSRAEKIIDVDAFGNDPLSADALGLSLTTSVQTNNVND